MIIIFSALLILGVVQIFLLFLDRKKTEEKFYSTNMIAIQHRQKQKLGIEYFIRRCKECLVILRLNLMGRNNELMLKNLAVVFISTVLVTYINYEYLNFNSIIIFLFTFLVIEYIFYIKQKSKNRRDFERDFSEALNIINSTVRVGKPIFQGFEECVKTIDSEFGRELKRILMRLDIGDEPERVFIESYKRYPYMEYFSFIITILINMKGGGQVSEVMSRLTMLISTSKALERKKLAMTAEARLSVKVLVIIPVFFFFFLKFFSPDSFDVLINTQAGKYIIYYAVGSIFTGLFVIWAMMNKVG